MIDEQSIVMLTPELMFSRDFMLELMDEEPEERARLSTLISLKAKELGVDKEFKSVLKSYNEADKKLAEEYNRQWRRENATIPLDFDGNGRPLPSIDNYVMVFNGDKKFAGIKFNLLTNSPEQEIKGEVHKWTDADDAETRRYIEKKYRFHNSQKCDDAFRIILRNRQYHPVKEVIEAVEWDGKSRIYSFLTTWVKCEDTPYTREVSRLIFAGGIHRLYNPGCKFDDMPVLIGTRQGEGKSTFVRWLALRDEFFAEVTEFEGQKAIEALEGAWICEVSELLALTKTKEQEAVKSYLTRLNDRYRKPFDKRVTDHLRQCIFIGTTNKEQFLTDKTGNRRFYPVKVNQSGYELFDKEQEVKEYIKQCWAEALVMFRNEELKPYADRSLLDVIRSKQSDAVEDDYRVGMIKHYLEDKEEVCILQLWQDALQMGGWSKPEKKDSNEIGLIMQSLSSEWEKQPKPKRMRNYGLQKWWKKVSFDNGPFNQDDADEDDDDLLVLP
jgi:hypothetical protein